MSSSMLSTMKIFLLVLSCAVNVAYANSKEYRSIIEQYALQEDDVLGYSEGIIDGEHYLAFIANRLSPKENNNPAIYLFTTNKAEPHSVAKIDLQGDYTSSYSMKIKNNSLYVQHSAGHNGWHDGRYQFKRVNQEFRLVGFEQQSMQLSCYVGDDSPNCTEQEIWSGTSYNLLTSSSICWQKTIHPSNELEAKEASDRYEKWIQPQKGVRHQMKLSQIDLPLLDGFDFFEFSLPKSCYFDSKNRLLK